MSEFVEFSVLKGKTIIKILGMEKDSDSIVINCSDGSDYRMYHEQDCCEDVWLEDVSGDISNLLDTPILSAELTTDSQELEYGSQTYSYYHLRTAKGYVDLRWCGQSNGYYSEEVDFVKL